MEQKTQSGKEQGGFTREFKNRRKDGFLNKELRILTVAAFLRCLYAAIEYAPQSDLRLKVI